LLKREVGQLTDDEFPSKIERNHGTELGMPIVERSPCSLFQGIEHVTSVIHNKVFGRARRELSDANKVGKGPYTPTRYEGEGEGPTRAAEDGYWECVQRRHWLSSDEWRGQRNGGWKGDFGIWKSPASLGVSERVGSEPRSTQTWWQLAGALRKEPVAFGS
jgi:hypothetical protein